jgi:hypothetical protein
MIVKYYLTAYPAVYGQFQQAIPQPIAAVPAQREGKKKDRYFNNKKINNTEQLIFIVLNENTCSF